MHKIAIGLVAIAATLCGARAQPVGGAVEEWYEVAHRLPDYHSKSYCEVVVRRDGHEPSQQIWMRKEEKARAILQTRWQSYPERKRAQCIRDGASVMMNASYDSLLWCLDRTAWQKIKNTTTK